MNINEIILMCVVFVSMIVLFITIIKNQIHYKKNSIMSFQESINLTEIPIVTFYNSGRKFNFILDTGSNNSLIDKRLLDKFKHEILDEKTSIATSIDGSTENTGSCLAILKYNGLWFEEKFKIKDMSVPFDSIKESDGVTIHGILGSNFFANNKYVLDFDKMVAFIKKK